MSETKNDGQKNKRKGSRRRSAKKWLKRLILLAIAVAALLFALKAYIQHQASLTDEGESYSQAAVMRGSIAETVYGTGTTSASNQPGILAQADGTLTELRVSVGDTVKEGDILAVITNDTIDASISDLEFALWDLDDTITGTMAGSKVSVIAAPASGRLVAMYAKGGDDALAVFRREGALAIISTDGRMKVELSSSEHVLGLELDQTVTVYGDGILCEGKVVDLTRQGTCATITMKEEDLPFVQGGESLLGCMVSVRDADGREIGSGDLQANKPMAVSSYGGTILSTSFVVNQSITRNETLYRLTDSPLTLRVEELRLKREAAAKELEDAKLKRENLIVLAPCDGTVASLVVSEGDEVTEGMLLGSILHGEDMNLTIAVDELDVVEVEIGQKVDITIDALSDVTMEGEVSKIAPVGVSAGGVTTYDVQLTFDATGSGVRSGMNATGEIQVAYAEDALYVPVEALMTMGNQTYVMVADGSGTSAWPMEQNAQRGGHFSEKGDAKESERAFSENGMPSMDDLPDGSERQRRNADDAQEEATLMSRILGVPSTIRAWLYEGISGTSKTTGSLVQVEVGLQNDDYAEIRSGLSEGDVVLYTGSAQESSSFSFGERRGGDRGAGMGGMAMPMGGF